MWEEGVVIVAGVRTSSCKDRSSRVVKLDPDPVPSGSVRDPVPPSPPCSSSTEGGATGEEPRPCHQS